MNFYVRTICLFVFLLSNCVSARHKSKPQPDDPMGALSGLFSNPGLMKGLMGGSQNNTSVGPKKEPKNNPTGSELGLPAKSSAPPVQSGLVFSRGCYKITEEGKIFSNVRITSLTEPVFEIVKKMLAGSQKTFDTLMKEWITTVNTNPVLATEANKALIDMYKNKLVHVYNCLFSKGKIVIFDHGVIVSWLLSCVRKFWPEYQNSDRFNESEKKLLNNEPVAPVAPKEKSEHDGSIIPKSKSSVVKDKKGDKSNSDPAKKPKKEINSFEQCNEIIESYPNLKELYAKCSELLVIKPEGNDEVKKDGSNRTEQLRLMRFLLTAFDLLKTKSKNPKNTNKDKKNNTQETNDENENSEEQEEQEEEEEESDNELPDPFGLFQQFKSKDLTELAKHVITAFFVDCKKYEKYEGNLEEVCKSFNIANPADLLKKFPKFAHGSFLSLLIRFVSDNKIDYLVNVDPIWSVVFAKNELNALLESIYDALANAEEKAVLKSANSASVFVLQHVMSKFKSNPNAKITDLIADSVKKGFVNILQSDCTQFGNQVMVGIKTVDSASIENSLITSGGNKADVQTWQTRVKETDFAENAWILYLTDIINDACTDCTLLGSLLKSNKGNKFVQYCQSYIAKFGAIKDIASLVNSYFSTYFNLVFADKTCQPDSILRSLDKVAEQSKKELDYSELVEKVLQEIGNNTKVTNKIKELYNCKGLPSKEKELTYLDKVMFNLVSKSGMMNENSIPKYLIPQIQMLMVLQRLGLNVDIEYDDLIKDPIFKTFQSAINEPELVKKLTQDILLMKEYKMLLILIDLYKKNQEKYSLENWIGFYVLPENIVYFLKYHNLLKDVESRKPFNYDVEEGLITTAAIDAEFKETLEVGKIQYDKILNYFNVLDYGTPNSFIAMNNYLSSKGYSNFEEKIIAGIKKNRNCEETEGKLIYNIYRLFMFASILKNMQNLLVNWPDVEKNKVIDFTLSYFATIHRDIGDNSKQIAEHILSAFLLNASMVNGNPVITNNAMYQSDVNIEFVKKNGSVYNDYFHKTFAQLAEKDGISVENELRKFNVNI